MFKLILRLLDKKEKVNIINPRVRSARIRLELLKYLKSSENIYFIPLTPFMLLKEDIMEVRYHDFNLKGCIEVYLKDRNTVYTHPTVGKYFKKEVEKALRRKAHV